MIQDETKSKSKKLFPIVGDYFIEDPFYIPLSEESAYFELFADVSQSEFQKSLDEVVLSKKTKWSFSGYLENRTTFLKEFPHMVTTGRYYHLGIDINVPCGTKLYTPFDCEVESVKYEEGEGNYGGIIVHKCQNPQIGIFYLLFGHLAIQTLPQPGIMLKKGEPFAQIGDMSQNGNWFYHTHLQVLTQKAINEGWIEKGYCNKNEIATIGDLCPNPLLFL